MMRPSNVANLSCYNSCSNVSVWNGGLPDDLVAVHDRGPIHSAATSIAANASRHSSAFPDTATPEDIRHFQMHLAEPGISICNRNRIMTSVRFTVIVALWL